MLLTLLRSLQASSVLQSVLVAMARRLGVVQRDVIYLERTARYLGVVQRDVRVL